MHPTNRERQTGGESPHGLAAQQDFAAVAQGASVIDSAPGDAGAVTVRRTAGKPVDPFAPLLDRSDPTSYVVAPDQPRVRVEHWHGGKP